MIRYCGETKILEVRNRTLLAVFDCSRGITVSELSNRLAGVKSNCGRELLNLEFKGGRYTSADFETEDVAVGGDATRELATVLLRNESIGVDLRVHFLNDKKDTLNIILQAADHYRDGLPHKMLFHSPFLAGFGLGGGKDVYYYPGCPARRSSGKGVVRPVRESVAATDVKLPLVVCDGENRFGFSLRFPSCSDLTDDGSTQNRNLALAGISDGAGLKNHRIPLAPDGTFNDSVEFEIVGLCGGWAEAFGRFREIWSAGYDFSEYEREDLRWFGGCAVHGFAFLYGREAFDGGSKTVDAEKYLKDGEKFGGYDTVTLWNQYPRLGVDRRSQWNFYDDFPGGREALKKAVDEFHRKNVAVFLPFLPWDRGPGESTDSMGDRAAELIRETGADGYQLDTMQSVPESFREKLDRVRPGIVLTSQKHPMKKHPLEIITTSWDEFWDTDCMPQIDLLRYLLPGHVAPALSRWCRAEDKDRLIRYAVFNAEPIVIWQDVFGRWMPYSAEQKAEIKAWKKVYLKNREVYQGPGPVPLYPVGAADLYCNAFCSEDGSRRIFSVYNDGGAFEGEVLTLPEPGWKTVSEVFGRSRAELRGSRLYASIPANEVVHIGVTADRPGAGTVL